MHDPLKYSHEQWASWCDRARSHTHVAPGLTADLRSSTGVITGSLIATAAASLAELDDDIVEGEFLTRFMQPSVASKEMAAIVQDLSEIAQDLLQAIVEANGDDGGYWYKS